MKKILQFIGAFLVYSFCLLCSFLGFIFIFGSILDSESDFIVLGIYLLILCGIVFSLYKYSRYRAKVREKDREAELKFDKKMLENGYNKIYKNKIYVNEKENMIYINGNYYGFSDIIDSSIVSNTQVENISENHTRTYCTELYINIVVNNMSRPSERIYFIRPGLFSKVDKEDYTYKEYMGEINNILNVLKIVINKGQNSYLKNGTKVEHTHVIDDTMSKIQKLSELHDGGVLTDYEFSTKKKELLDKLK